MKNVVLIKAESLSLTDFASGIISITNEGFPLESDPPQGIVKITFGTNRQIEIMADENEYKKALVLI